MNRELSYKAATRIILIGTTECPYDPKNLPPLPQVEANIDELSRLFRDPAVIGLDDAAELVRLLDLREASAVLDRVATEAKQATGTLVVYYAGHGLYGDAKEPLYLAARNSTSGGRRFNAIPVNGLREAIATSTAKQRILMLDCCFSGSGLGLMSGADTIEQVTHAIDIEGTYAIAAVPANMKALAPPGNRLTVFTEALVDVLEKGVEGKTSVLSLGDIFDEVRSRLKRRADVPLPEGLAWKDGRDFKFARNRFVRHDNLDVLANSVEQLRLTVAQYGAQIERLEAVARGPGQQNASGAAQREPRVSLITWVNIIGYLVLFVLVLVLQQNPSYSLEEEGVWGAYLFVLYGLLLFNFIVVVVSLEKGPEFDTAKNILGTREVWGARRAVFLFLMAIVVMLAMFGARREVMDFFGRIFAVFGQGLGIYFSSR